MLIKSTQGIAIPKKDNKIRPVGLRDGFLNLTSKCVLKHLQEDTFKIFDGINYALAGPKKMDELIALVAHSFRVQPDHDRIFIDCTNAFNRVDRAEAATEILNTCPKLAKYFYFLYEDNTNIWMRSDEETWSTIIGSQGGVQGCVQAPIIFGFGSLKPYKSINALLSLKENAFFGAFLDDSVISAAHEDAITGFDIFRADGPKHGLDINYAPNKTVVLLGRCDNEEEMRRRILAYTERGIPLTNIKVHPDNGGAEEDYGYVHLGVPVGSKLYQHDHLHSLVDKFISSCECDNIVDSAQEKWVYLLWVIRQKFPFWFRHMCPSITATVQTKVEDHLRSKFNTILGQTTLNREWEQACLPTRAHGCGLGNPCDIISSAFAANVEETIKAVKAKLPSAKPYMEIIHAPQETVDTFQYPSEDIKTFVQGARQHKLVVQKAADDLGESQRLKDYDNKTTKTKTQRFYSDFINRSRAREMELTIADHAEPYDRARFLSTNGSFAGAWLFNIPKDHTSIMTTSEFRIALKLRLGVRINNLIDRCSCVNNTRICENAVHLFSCNDMKGFQTLRHNAIQNDLFQMAQHGAIRVRDAGLGGLLEEDGRKGDLLFSGMGANDSDLVVDITVAHPCNNSYLNSSTHIEKYALSLLEQRKIEKYAQAYRRVGIDFKPLAFEMFGATSDIFTKLFKNLTRAAADLNDIPYSVMFSYWQRRISTTIQMYNAKIINLSQLKLSRSNGSREMDFDLVHAISNERLIHTHA
jgi:hypothetical protein